MRPINWVISTHINKSQLAGGMTKIKVKIYKPCKDVRRLLHMHERDIFPRRTVHASDKYRVN